MRRLYKISLALLLVIFMALVSMYFLVQIPSVQTYITKRVTNIVSTQLNTKVEIGKVDIKFFRRIYLEQLYIEDQQGDTLLYAGLAHVKFKLRSFFQKEVELRYAELSDVRVNLYREAGDNTFNYDFLGGPKDTTVTKQTGNNEPWEIKINNIKFQGLDFDYRDDVKEVAYEGDLKQLDLVMNEVDLKGGVVDIEFLKLYGTKFFYHKYSEPVDKEKVLTEGVEELNTGNWKINVNIVQLSDSEFRLLDECKPKKPDGIDFTDLLVSDINVTMTDLQVVKDTLFATVEKLSAKEKSGFQIESLQSNAIVSQHRIECRDLVLQTPNSNITNYFGMFYDNFSHFQFFLDNVRMRGEFNNAKLSMKDINYFAKSLDKIEHNTITLDGVVRGPVSKLKGRNLVMGLGRNSSFKGDFSLTGLPKFNETFIEFEIDRLKTDISDAKRIYPHINYPKNAASLGTVRFSGEFIGFISDFVADGELYTQIGSVSSDINFKIDQKTRIASYSGIFEADQFDLGAWTAKPELLGPVTLKTNIKGKGTKLKDVDTKLDGVISSLSLKGYTYDSITVSGNIKDELFAGSLFARDENLDLDFEGTIDLEKALPIAQFKARLGKADLKAMNLTKDHFVLSTKMDIDIEGFDLDDINGTVFINNTRITKNDTLYKIKKIALNAYKLDSARTLNLISDPLEVDITGRFTFKELPAALANVLQHYSKPKEGKWSYVDESIAPQNFKLSVRINDTKNLTRLVSPALENIKNGVITGNFNSINDRFQLNGNIENIRVSGNQVQNISLRSSTVNNRVLLQVKADTVKNRAGSKLFDNVVISTSVKEDSIRFGLNVFSPNAPTRVDIQGLLKTDLSYISANLSRSKIVVENEVWKISRGSYIYLDSNTLVVDSFMFSNQGRKITINTFKNTEDRTNLKVGFKDFPLDMVSSLLSAPPLYAFGGTANGNAIAVDVLGERTFTASLNVEELMFSQDTLGDLELKTYFDKLTNRITSIGSLQGNGNSLKVYGYYAMDGQDSTMRYTIDADKARLGILKPFLSSFTTKFGGDVSGKLYLLGSLKKPILYGDAKVNNAEIRIDFLNVTYNFDNEVIKLRENLIELGELNITDPDGAPATISGSIEHEYFKDFALDLTASIPNEKNFQLMYTNAAQNEQLYGKAYGSGIVTLKGPVTDIELYAGLTTGKNTDISIPVASSSDVAQYSFYQFIDKDAKKKEKQLEYVPKRSPLSIDLDLDIQNNAKANIILSQEQGDVIQSIGNGNLDISLGNFGELEIAGTYNVDDGDYTFSLQNIINKEFDIEQGSSIVWTGEPYNANLNINAVYRLRAAPYDLIEDVVTNNNVGRSKTRVPVYLYLRITGTLLDPQINFDISVPDADPGIRSAVDAKLTLIKQDQTELNKQVVGLLVLNRFLPVYPVGTGGADVTFAEGATNTVSEFVSNQLSLYLSDWISQVVTDVEIDINYREYQSELDDGTAVGTDDFESRRELQLALSKSFFNDRISVDIGGNFDFGQENVEGGEEGQTQRNNNIAGDFEIQYSITPDGRIRAKVFRKGEYDVFEERNRNKTGIGISYTRQFDDLKDLRSLLKERRERRQEKRQKKKEKQNTDDRARPPAIEPRGEEDARLLGQL